MKRAPPRPELGVVHTQRDSVKAAAANRRNHDAHSFGKAMLKPSSKDSCIRSTVFAAKKLIF